MEYTVIMCSAGHADDVAEYMGIEVNKRIEEGWQLSGGMSSILKHEHSGVVLTFYLFQPMIKP